MTTDDAHDFPLDVDAERSLWAFYHPAYVPRRERPNAGAVIALLGLTAAGPAFWATLAYLAFT